MAAETWNLDPVHSSINFWVRHLMVTKIHGRFATWKGSLSFDEQAPESARVEVEIDASSIDTKVPDRDAHLRSPDFFDVQRFPTLTFTSTAVKRDGDGAFKLTGDLTMHGITRPVTLDVEYSGRVKDSKFGERVGFSARGTLNRKDHGIVWNEILDAGGVALGDKIEVNLEIQATKQA